MNESAMTKCDPHLQAHTFVLGVEISLGSLALKRHYSFRAVRCCGTSL